MTQSEQKHSRFEVWHFIIFLGCTLLLLGNTLPWPCPPGFSSRECTVLVTYQLSDSWYGIMLAVGLRRREE